MADLQPGTHPGPPDSGPAGAGGGSPPALRPSPAVLQCFWGLASAEPGPRRAAAAQLLGLLAAAAREHAAAHPGPDAGAAAACPAVQYALKRLAKGLASSRLAARQGFATALCGLVRAGGAGLGAGEVVALLEAELHGGSGRGGHRQDAGERAMGHLFGLAALARAGALAGDAGLAAAAADRLVELGRKRSFLREPAALALVELFDRADAAALARVLEGSAVPELWAPADPTPEGLLLAARAAERLGGAPPGPCPAFPGWDDGFFAEDHLAGLVGTFQAATFCHPRLHSLWGAVVARIAPSVATEEDGALRVVGQAHSLEGFDGARLQAFWRTVVERGLLPSSHERRYAALQLVTVLVPLVSSEYVPTVLSERVVKLLADNLARPDNHLHKCARWCVKQVGLYAVSEACPGGVSAAITLCLGPCTAHLKGAAEPAADDGATPPKALRLLASLRALFKERCASAQATVDSQKQIVNQVCTLFKTTGAEDGTHVEVLKFLGVVGMGRVKAKKPRKKELKEFAGVEFPEELRRFAARRLLGLLSNVVVPVVRPDKGEDARPARFSPTLLPRLLAFCNELARSKEFESPDAGDDPEFAALGRLSKALADAEEGPRHQSMLQLVDALCLFKLLDAEGEYEDVAGDLGVVVGQALPDVDLAGLDLPEADADVYWGDALVDILLATLSQPSAALRDAVSAVWRAFGSDVSLVGLQDLIGVLLRKDNREKGEGEGDGESEEESEEEEEESEGDDGEGNGALDLHEQPLVNGNAKVLQDLSGSGSGSEGEEEEDLDDDAMFKMDDAIANHLKLVKRQQEEKKEQRQALTRFKICVVALLEQYVRFQARDSTVLPLLVPDALRALATSFSPSERHVAEKFAGVLTKHLAKVQSPAGSRLEGGAAKAVEILDNTLKVAAKTRAKELSGVASQLAKYVLRVAVGAAGAREEDDGIRGAVGGALTEYLRNKECRLPRAYFDDVFQRYPKLGLHLLPRMGPFIEGARNDHCKVEALALVAAMLKSQKNMPEDLAALRERQLREHAGTAMVALDAATAGGFKKVDHGVHALKHAAALAESLADELHLLDRKGLAKVRERARAADQVHARLAAHGERLAALLAEDSGKRKSAGAPPESPSKKKKKKGKKKEKRHRPEKAAA